MAPFTGRGADSEHRIGPMTPRFVADILRSAWLWHLARVLITFMYWYAALGFVMDFSSAQAAVAQTGFQPTWLIAVLMIAILLTGSTLIILDRAVWLGPRLQP